MTRVSDKGAAVDAVQAVPPAAIEDQKARGWPDFHPEDFCHRCGHRNISWYTASPLWNEAWAVAEAEGGYQSVLCPRCFVELWEQATGLRVTWEVQLDRAVLLAQLRSKK